MAKVWRVVVAAVLLSGTGCCHTCGCCDWGSWWRDRPQKMRLDEGPPPLPVPAAGGTTVPNGTRSPTGAYGGS
jgi:hypothetical protein